MKRIRYFDLLRVICFSIVVFYHMMIQLYFNGMFAMDAIEPFFVTANINTGVVAVTLFFMLSGASLVISTKDSVDWKQFYIKRFIRLLFPFYFVNICWFIVRAIRAKSIFALIEGIAPWKILLGVLAGYFPRPRPRIRLQSGDRGMVSGVSYHSVCFIPDIQKADA